MKAKTIKSIIRKKHEDWMESIDCEETRKLVKKNTIVTGGSIVSMLLGEKVNDFDIYFRDLDTVLAVTEYYVNKFNNLNPHVKTEEGVYVEPAYYKRDNDRVKVFIRSAGVAGESKPNYQYFESQEPGSTAASDYVSEVIQEIEDETKPKYRPIFLSSNAITLSNKVQLVIRFYGEPEEIHKNYDFVHCTNYWDSATGDLVLHQKALESILSKELRYVGSKYPLCSIIRTRKFIARGWTINAGQYVKMAFQLQEFDLNDPRVLEEQLTGVDIHYFFEVIEALKKRDDKRVDTAYLMEVIDRIF